MVNALEEHEDVVKAATAAYNELEAQRVAEAQSLQEYENNMASLKVKTKQS